MRAFIIVISFAVCSCQRGSDSKFKYENLKYDRVTSNQDSAKNMIVEYSSKTDTSVKMIKYYFDNGMLMAKGYRKKNKDEGMWTQYDMEGNVLFRGMYLNGLKVDTHRLFHKNGKVSFLEIYHNDTPIGTWYEYDTSGIPINQKKF